MTKKLNARNIKIEFAGQRATLKDASDRVTLPSGVVLYCVADAHKIKPFAEIPDGTLDQYKHDRPRVLSQDWA